MAKKTEPSAFMELLEYFTGTYLTQVRGLSQNTVLSYKAAFRLLIDYLYTQRGIPASAITFQLLDSGTITGFMDWIEKERGCSASTRNQRFAAICSFAEFAQNRDFDAAASFRGAVRKIPLKKTVGREKAFFTMEELKILFSLPDERMSVGLRDKVLLCVLYSSGARAQEICDLTVKKVRFQEDGAEIDLVGKGRKARRVMVGNPSAGMLKKYISNRGIDHQPDRHVFSSLTHEMMSISCVEAVVKKYVATAKQEYPDLFLKKGYSPHSLRHSVAIHMLEAGVPLPVIQRFLGHASIMTTQIYARLAQETVDSQIQKWNAEYWGKYQNGGTISDEKSHIPGFLKGK